MSFVLATAAMLKLEQSIPFDRDPNLRQMSNLFTDPTKSTIINYQDGSKVNPLNLLSNNELPKTTTACRLLCSGLWLELQSNTREIKSSYQKRIAKYSCITYNPSQSRQRRCQYKRICQTIKQASSYGYCYNIICKVNVGINMDTIKDIARTILFSERGTSNIRVDQNLIDILGWFTTTIMVDRLLYEIKSSTTRMTITKRI